jgi:hypothetical protein
MPPDGAAVAPKGTSTEENVTNSPPPGYFAFALLRLRRHINHVAFETALYNQPVDEIT